MRRWWRRRKTHLEPRKPGRLRRLISHFDHHSDRTIFCLCGRVQANMHRAPKLHIVWNLYMTEVHYWGTTSSTALTTLWLQFGRRCFPQGSRSHSPQMAAHPSAAQYLRLLQGAEFKHPAG